MSTMTSLFFDKTSYSGPEELFRNRAIISGLSQVHSDFKIKIEGHHAWVEIGSGQPIIFCHGLFGSYRNFATIGRELSKNYRVIVPYLPMYDLPYSRCTVDELGHYLERFIDDLSLKNCILGGNSMGGGAVLNYAISHPQNVDRLMLFASSGLSFIPMRSGMMKIKNYEYVKSLLSDIFFDPSTIAEEEMKEVYQALQSKPILLRCLSFTRSTKKNFLHEKLRHFDRPTLVIWGKNDTVTPASIAEEFKVMQNSEIHILEDCGHVPCYEKPETCLELIKPFLRRAHDLLLVHK